MLAVTHSVAAESDPLVGTRPLEWQVTHWIRSEPLRLEDLRGRVVLVRFWTGPACPYCRASAPVLRELHEDLADRGLVVVGLYHHKGREPLDPRRVESLAEEMGMEFPVAVDDEWRTLRSWYLDRVPDAAWTSVTFLLGRDGRTRYVHPGGAYPPGSADAEALRAEVDALLGSEAP